MSENKRHTAGAFDIRNVIGALIGVYGVILVLVGLIAGSEPASTDSGADDVGANLWVGLAMIVVAAIFIAWAFLKPTVVDEQVVEETRHEDGPAV